ncbi:MAG: UDP-3-O-acyl-N-acetylglucosamine deacetylase [Bacteroidales bacterium]|nr:UDP-3-O-acyl-N-acetylglucosamine deacetylase [Bacteroidales bacterium]MDD5892631.1 UDP-3-O-acyl-N-acetylglucosamine deacetylase [Bacteroidales bacterium]MDY5356426.1 UDP-3-O-acyl-N-acetylglucosamine deacetylase [Candidatus Cryptobacteroides sp.]
MQFQQTLKKSYSFEGKGLHTGRYAKMTISPAPTDTGIRFRRTDLGDEAYVDALAENVSNTARSTTISSGDVSVMTIEHILSSLTGMGVDNALIDIDNVEVPILDGSAKPYIDAIWKDGFFLQDKPRHYIELKETVEIFNPEKGSFVRIEPAEEFSYNIKIDFNSKVLGVQRAQWDPSVVYAEQIGICRTFVFFHEIEYLFNNGLVKGGDVDNAIVIVEHPVTDEQVGRLASLFGIPALQVKDNGYLNNLELRFENECARHKLLDLIGDLRLCGGFLKAKVTAEKSGHGINTTAAKALRKAIDKTE